MASQMDLWSLQCRRGQAETHRADRLSDCNGTECQPACRSMTYSRPAAECKQLDVHDTCLPPSDASSFAAPCICCTSRPRDTCHVAMTSIRARRHQAGSVATSLLAWVNRKPVLATVGLPIPASCRGLLYVTSGMVATDGDWRLGLYTHPHSACCVHVIVTQYMATVLLGDIHRHSGVLPQPPWPTLAQT